jgi:adenylate cyclase
MARNPKNIFRLLLRRGRTPVILAFAALMFWFPQSPTLGRLLHVERFAELLSKVEQSITDYHFKVRGPLQANPNVALVGIDRLEYDADNFRPEEIASSEALQILTEHPYPWNRKIYALLIEKLVAAGAKVVAFDLLFEPDNPGDADLRAAIERHPGKIILGTTASPTADGNGIRFIKPNPNVAPGPTEDILGFVAYHPEPADGVIRRFDLYTSEIRELMGIEDLSPQYRCFAPRAAETAGFTPREEPYRKIIPFAGPSGTVKPLPLEEFFIDRIYQTDPRFAGGAAFKNKVVFVGPIAELFRDVHNTPFGVMPGVEIHAQLAGALISGQSIRDSEQRLNWWLALAFTALPALAVILGRSALLLAGLLAGLFASFLVASQFLFTELHVLIPSVPALFGLNTVGAFGIIYNFALEQLERSRIRSVLDRHVSKNIANKVIAHSDDFETMLRGERKMVTVLFSDVRGFTTIFESSDAETLVAQLNEYFHDMVDAVEREEGTLQKFIGDAIMAVWGDTHSAGPAADTARAVRSALLMRTALLKLNEGWKSRPDRIQLKIGIGINHGEVIVGEIGHPRRMEFTALGDAVNLASRLEGATKQFGCDILVGERSEELTRAEFVYRQVDRLRLKGKNRSVDVFLPLSGSEIAPPPWLARYHAALGLYRFARFSEASDAFSALLTEVGDDFLCSMYLERSKEFIQNPPPPDWDGVHTLTEK